MIQESAKRQFDVIIVWKLDRFARNRYDSAHYKHILKKNGVTVVSAKENISSGPEGILMESMLEGMAEYYSANLSENIHRGQKENALKGLNNGGGIPLGYLLGDDKKLKVDPLTAPVVVEIFQKYAEGMTVRSIIEDLNEHGLRTKQNKPFNLNSFNTVLKNRKYIGEYQYQKVVIPGGVPSIVPEDLFNRVQERMEKNRRAPARAKYTSEVEYLLTTKLFCGSCQRMMVGESGTSGTAGRVYHYYKCGGAKRKKGCKKKAVPKEWIENHVIRLIREHVLIDKVIKKIAHDLVEYQKKENTNLALLLKQKEDIKKSLFNLLKALEAGIFSETTQQRLVELEQQKEDIEIAIAKERTRTMNLSEEQVMLWFRSFQYGDVNDIDYRRQLIDCFVNRIFMFDDRLVLTFNASSTAKEITFNLLESSDMGTRCPPRKVLYLQWVQGFFMPVDPYFDPLSFGHTVYVLFHSARTVTAHLV